ncbi:MAG: alpha/beta hydrolase [Bacteroidota bacterium]|nr:alpha/beta hydrolase [Bacteroidota bacterium]
MKHVIFRNKKIVYRVEGNGKAVMLLHGFAENGTIWNYQVDMLKENFRIIIPDIPGSGESEMLEGKVSITDYADAIKAIADAEIKIADFPFTIIGHSMGGYIALAFAENYPELLDGLGLFHSTSYADDEQKKETRRKGIEFIKKNGPKCFLKNTSPNLFSEKTKQESPELIEELIELSKNFSAEVLIQYYETMIERPDRSHVLTSFKKPVLLIAGAYDNAVPLQSSLQQSYLSSVTHFHILKSSGHMGLWEEKEASSILMGDFFKEINPGVFYL